ncbi:MAG: hypothetical protein QOC93_2763 [Actinomycetota bacterium]|jgi:hypothetical protein|nr:hypothetical protein [Actinomycetota bacterium]
MPIAVGIVLLTVAVTVAVFPRSVGHGSLDPRSVDPDGTRALATILGQHDVTVERVSSTDRMFRAATGPVTVVVPVPGLLSPDTLDRLAELAGNVRIVLVEPDPLTLDDLGTGVREKSARTGPTTRPRCPLRAAAVAGPADVDGLRYTGRDAVSCYGGGLLVSGGWAGTDGTGPRIAYLGSAAPLTNERLAERGNAALALGLLSETPRVLWLTLAAPELDSGGGAGGVLGVLPGWVLPVTAQLLLAGLLAALWQGRRLGAPVAEPLPVIVRSAETVEGRARLYRRSRARDRALTALRGGALSRLLPALRLGPDPARRAVVEAVADRSGGPAADVDALLYGPAPADDARLVAAADGLDRLVDATLHPRTAVEGNPQ